MSSDLQQCWWARQDSKSGRPRWPFSPRCVPHRGPSAVAGSPADGPAAREPRGSRPGRSGFPAHARVSWLSRSGDVIGAQPGGLAVAQPVETQPGRHRRVPPPSADPVQGSVRGRAQRAAGEIRTPRILTAGDPMPPVGVCLYRPTLSIHDPPGDARVRRDARMLGGCVTRPACQAAHEDHRARTGSPAQSGYIMIGTRPDREITPGFVQPILDF